MLRVTGFGEVYPRVIVPVTWDFSWASWSVEALNSAVATALFSARSASVTVQAVKKKRTLRKLKILYMATLLYGFTVW